MGTVQANANAIFSVVGDGWVSAWNYGVGAISPGIRIEDTDGVSGSPTAGQTLFVADPVVALRSTVPTFQDATGLFDVRQSGQPSVYLPRHTGSSFFEGPASFGAATSGLLADTGQYWHTVEIYRTLITITVLR